MKKIILWLLALVAYADINAQCNCGGNSAASVSGESGPVIQTLEKKQWLFDFFADGRMYKEGEHDHSTHNLVKHGQTLKGQSAYNIGVRYGITDRITVSIVFPYMQVGTETERNRNWGDITLMGTINLLNRSTTSVAATLGIDLPTGPQTFLNGVNWMSIGSGSSDPLAGISIIHKNNRTVWKGNVLYKKSFNGFGGYNFGDYATEQFQYNYSVVGKDGTCTAGIKNFQWTTGMSIVSEHFGKQRLGKIYNEQTGGNFVYMGWVNIFKAGNIYIPFNVMLPVYQGLNGNQPLISIRFRGGISWLIN